MENKTISQCEEALPRKEYPRPQFERSKWINLNGKWQFEIDNGKSGQARGLQNVDVTLSDVITVPFCPQSKLSGIENKDFLAGVWYKRSFEISELSPDENVVIHFGAVDYIAYVYINGQLAGKHRGGYVSFEFDITKYVKQGENIVTVYAEDDERSPLVPRGKQSEKYFSSLCDYTRTTGIWQTVWLEFVPRCHIKSVKYYPDITNSAVTIEADLVGKGTLSVEISYEGRQVANAKIDSFTGNKKLTLPLSETHLWEVGHGRLYDVTLSYNDDTVKSYFGLREVRLDGMKFLINGKSVFQRLVLDQGFYPDGIYTAPDDSDLIKDIDLSLACGFNGARLHEKVFEERFLYHCDKKGYIVWGEYPDWGLDISDPENIYSILPEWIEEVNRDFNHPSIIGWCPHNETWDFRDHPQYEDSIIMMYNVTKELDRTRPCIDTSGHYHVQTDIFDVHDYTQNPDELRENYAKIGTEKTISDRHAWRQTYAGEPLFVSEFGGIKWSNDDEDSWGYGETPKSREEFIERFEKLCYAVMDNENIFGFCYTQLIDVEQEQNGLYTYHREAKFEPEIFKNIISKPAAIEKE